MKEAGRKSKVRVTSPSQSLFNFQGLANLWFALESQKRNEIPLSGFVKLGREKRELLERTRGKRDLEKSGKKGRTTG